MKQGIVLLLTLGLSSPLFAFEGNDDNVTRDYYVQLYKTQDYVLDFRTVFANEADRSDYRKLREYLDVKEEIVRILKMAGDEYYYGLSYSKQYTVDYIQSLEDELSARDPNDKILLRLHSVRPPFDFNGEFTVGHVQTVILPAIRQRFMEATERDSINQAIYMHIQKNVGAINQDVFQAEQAIHASLSPEFRDQDFRIWISLTFSGLIAVILFSFFLIIYRRSDGALYKQMLSSAGLQFITVFVLIIAIILFGILKVLGGSELAAILSGISGYILGKGGAEVVGKAAKEKETPETFVQSAIRDSPGKEPEVTVETPLEREEKNRIETEVEEEMEEEKFFPGGY